MLLRSSATRRRPASPKSSKSTLKVNHASRETLKSPAPKQPAAGIPLKSGQGKHIKKTVSISGLFQRPITKEPSRRSQRRKRAAPEHELFLDYQDNISNAADITLSEAKAKLSSTHTRLLSQITDLEVQNSAFEASVEADTGLIFSSLEGEELEASAKTEDGSKIKETFEIGKKVAASKLATERKRVELRECWAEWEEVQREIVELGATVLGEQCPLFGGEVMTRAEIEKSMEAGEADAEFERALLGLKDEIDGIEEEFVEKMAASEKEIALRQKRERSKLLAELLAADD